VYVDTHKAINVNEILMNGEILTWEKLQMEFRIS